MTTDKMIQATEYDRKVEQAISYMRLHGDTQEARHAAAANDDRIDTAQWADATKWFGRLPK